VKNIVYFFISLLAVCQIKAHTLEEIPFPVVGKPFPDVHFNDVEHYTKGQMAVSEGKGKWQVLYCFNSECAPCMAYLPALDTLQKLFSGKVRMLLVGYTGSMFLPGEDKRMRTSYEQVREHANLQLPIAYDSLMYHQFGSYRRDRLSPSPWKNRRCISGSTAIEAWVIF
jgi:thiol-disulfide isomerase/thioredoxin